MNNHIVDFIGIGAPRCGTTWFVDSIKEHPDIFVPQIKEVSFFFLTKDGTGPYTNGIKFYEKFFKDAKPGQVKGEFSTLYYAFDNSFELITKHLPDVKLLVNLRNPADMLYSFYWWRKSTFESAQDISTFEEAIEKDPFYLKLGKYYTNLLPYFNFYTKEKIKVTLMEDIQNRPENVIKETFEFLGVDASFKPKSINNRINTPRTYRNKHIAQIETQLASIARKVKLNHFFRELSRKPLVAKIYFGFNSKPFVYPKISHETKKYLTEYFRDEISKLETLFNIDLSSWKR